MRAEAARRDDPPRAARGGVAEHELELARLVPAVERRAALVALHEQRAVGNAGERQRLDRASARARSGRCGHAPAQRGEAPRTGRARKRRPRRRSAGKRTRRGSARRIDCRFARRHFRAGHLYLRPARSLGLLIPAGGVATRAISGTPRWPSWSRSSSARFGERRRRLPLESPATLEPIGELEVATADRRARRGRARAQGAARVGGAASFARARALSASAPCACCSRAQDEFVARDRGARPASPSAEALADRDPRRCDALSVLREARAPHPRRPHRPAAPAEDQEAAHLVPAARRGRHHHALELPVHPRAEPDGRRR